jgi:hypothetical protein
MLPESRPREAGARAEGIAFWPIANAVALLALVTFILVELLGEFSHTRSFEFATLHDYLNNLISAQTILERLEYLPELFFFYPPPFLVVQDALWALGVPGAAAVGLSLLGLVALACPFLALECVGLGRDRRRGVLAFAAVVAVVYFLQWDLRAANFNQLFMACVLGSLVCVRRGRPGLAGFLLATSVALKLYSILLLPYLLWRREKSWLLWSLVWLAFLFLVLPVLRFGPEDTLLLYASWIDVIGGAGDPIGAPDYYKNLERTLLALLTAEGGGADGIAQLEAGTVRLLAQGIWLVWVGAIAAFLVRGRSDGSGERRYVEVAALLLLCVLISPTFQPHHGVVCLLPAVWGVRVAGDGSEPFQRRLWAGAFLVVAALLVLLTHGWPARALAIQLALALYLVLIMALPPRVEALAERAAGREGPADAGADSGPQRNRCPASSSALPPRAGAKQVSPPNHPAGYS